MVLIDTSCWTQALRRKGDPTITARVRTLLNAGEAAWCDIVRLELWNGASNDWDRRLLEFLEGNVIKLPTTQDVWQHATQVATFAREKGISVPSTDILIFACGHVHKTPIERNDKHFDLLDQLFPI